MKAQECAERARLSVSPFLRQAFLQMAEEWSQLADEEENAANRSGGSPQT